MKRTLLRLSALLTVMALVILPWQWTLAADGEGGASGKTGLSVSKCGRTLGQNLMFCAAEFLSGINSMIASSPALDPTDRVLGRGLESPMASGEAAPLSQGGAALVPFRNPAPAFSRNVLVTRDFSNAPLQTEPHIAVDPKDPDHLVMGTIDYNFPNISTYTSIDGGANWDGPVQVPFLRDDLAAGGDPNVRFDRNGNTFVAYISIGVEEYAIGPYSAETEVSSIALSSSPDGGITWAQPVSTARSTLRARTRLDQQGLVRGDVTITFLDKPWMAIGPSKTDPTKDVIYVTYTDFNITYQILYIGEIPVLDQPQMETTIRMVKSEDGGKTWSQPIAASPTVRRIFGAVPLPSGTPNAVGTKRTVQGSQPAVGPDGTLYVAWLDSTDDDSQKGIAETYVAISKDNGKTFGTPTKVASFNEIGFRPRTAFFRYWAAAFPEIATGPKGEVYIAYTAIPPDRPQDDGDIYLVRSLDNGATWTRPKRINEDDTSRLQFYPAIAVGPDGTVHLMWGDMRDDPVQVRYNIYYTRSKDQGETWGFTQPELNIRAPDTRVTDFGSNANKGFPGGRFLGDYFSIAASSKDVYMVWADTRLGEFGGLNQKIGFARQRAIRSPELFVTPPAGPGGQDITIQGFDLQPDMNVFIQVGDATISSTRTNESGRFTARVFVPISGEGSHSLSVVDESGNRAAASFFTEFGFNNVKDQQDQLAQKLDALAKSSAGGDTLQQVLTELKTIRQGLSTNEGSGSGGGSSTVWIITTTVLGSAVVVTWILSWYLLRMKSKKSI